jgi:hypothetical protein
MEKWIALLIVFALVRPLVWGTLVLLMWAISRAALPPKLARKACGHFYAMSWREVFLVAATGRREDRRS